ncbi:MAG: hypothetical protein N2654_05375 [Deltaproteobacteria bacterium]|nr:hypothetical protein [Deltaproteobacteria bacterium]
MRTRFLKQKKGQGIIEYIVLLAGILLIAAAVVVTFGFIAPRADAFIRCTIHFAAGNTDTFKVSKPGVLEFSSGNIEDCASVFSTT